ncbi:ADP-heptose:LPS heptosyltransferase [Evansella vedderi]|uniref:ADP-heptose:LPS heptosyltransferase n=1 Tax=Evansella vedderi TaxID=38282 RepID=A0ABU0A000_9BACI|nr:DinB family protein [Evansella vedderi]MDQ0256819.1 ADP-heptose:LPS heptosyltransferase [Evansella vedderi]
MEEILFKQLQFVRDNTLKTLETITEDHADQIPEGFHNNIRWNLGHIYFVLEVFAFERNELPTKLPQEFYALFAPGTSPAEWKNAPTPTLSELTLLLQEQQGRIKTTLEGRLHEKAKNPLITKSGLNLETVGEFLNFNLFHEGVHFSTIQLYKRLLQK